jgi:hypothetical protein
MCAARRTQAVIVQADGHSRTNRDSRLDGKEIRREQCRVDIRTGENEVAGILQVPPQNSHLDGFALSGPQWENRDDRGAQVGQIGIAAGSRGEQ